MKALPSSFLSLLGTTFFAMVFYSCDQLPVEKPQVSEAKSIPTIDHSGINSNCISCHEMERFPVTNEFPHGEGKDCSECHKYDKTKKWTNLLSFKHDPMPNSCNSCHEPSRPEKPHTQTGECASCHSYPQWRLDTASLHDPIPSSCISCHEKDRPSSPHEKTKDCVGCHAFPNWKRAASFDHIPEPESCVTCHESQRPTFPHPQESDCKSCHKFPSFTNALFSHTPKPESCGEYCHTRPTNPYNRAYPNQGPPLGYQDGDDGSGHLLGKDCSECHLTPVENKNTWEFNHSTPKLTFCLPCHFNEGKTKHGTNNPLTYILEGFGNCYSCHKNYDKSQSRNWDD
ncbi:MAG: cytochrome c3 family protein [Bdellovibrionota bacterium]